VDETFPASNPISPSAAMHAAQPVRTGADGSVNVPAMRP
jgi:hypothetical protein